MKIRFDNIITILLLVFVLVFGASGDLLAQVSIAPTTVFISHNTHFGTFSIQNTSNKEQEVSIRFKFGYAATDSVGNMAMNYSDTARAHKYSIAKWIHVFPKSFTLKPSQTQTIRIMARPPATLSEGMYWSRMFITSNPQSSLVGSKNNSNVSASINFRFVQVTTVFYNNGGAQTGIEFKNLNLQKKKNKINFLSNIEQTGNAPFLGTVRLKVYNSEGKMVTSNILMTTIYFNETIRMSVNRNKLPSGNYKALVTLTSGRRDIDNRDIVKTQPVSKSIKFRIQ